MLLRDLIGQLDVLPEEATIFAARLDGQFTPNSESVCLELAEADSQTSIREVALRMAPGKEYFLEVFVAREVVDGWRSMHGVGQLGIDEATRIAIHYAENDAWPDPEAG